ncbi:hypothetical protein BKA70DRAFT_1442861 [Coprinopsis sp. MPI-PUGE-AT-0042]|nr:hypothetical protein BKA70DRAFT_1442861 [Coprinopsis sp. MPI-PUGE-AT-0042]
MEWVCVPKRDSRVYLKAKVKNNSEYTLLQGPANIYVDGSLVARSNLPFPGPLYSRHLLSVVEEDHNANRLHDQTKQGAVVTQRVTIHNTKSSALAKLKVIDQIPISEEAGIVVKVISPVLPTTPSSSGHAKTTSDAGQHSKYLIEGLSPLPNSVSIAQGIIAQWEGLEDVTIGDALGKDMSSIADGKFAWVCTNIASQGKVNLLLQWEVSAPTTTDQGGAGFTILHKASVHQICPAFVIGDVDVGLGMAEKKRGDFIRPM